MMRCNPAKIMNPELFNLLKVLVYLIMGTIGIVLFAGWALKRFGPQKNNGAENWNLIAGLFKVNSAPDSLS